MRDATRIEEMKDEHTCTCWEERGRSREEIEVHGEGEVRGVHNKEKGEGEEVRCDGGLLESCHSTNPNFSNCKFYVKI